MTCYMHRLDWLLDNLKLEISKTNRKMIDKALRKYYKFSADDPCEKVWEKLSSLTEEERLELTEKIVYS